MPCRILPIEEIEHLGTKFWVPAGGRENGVEATVWTILAELEGNEVSPVLSKLAAANVAGRAVAIAAATQRGNAHHRLYVDAMKYNQAMDALMLALRGKENQEVAGYIPRRRATKSASPATISTRGQAAKIALRIGQWTLVAAAFALMLGIGYATVSHRFPVVHSRPHHEQVGPGIYQPSTRQFP
jgi:hypothetical protein